MTTETEGRISMIQKDLHEVRGLGRVKTQAKSFYHLISRPMEDRILRSRLGYLYKDPVFSRTSTLLKNEGGMYKRFAFGLSDKRRPLKGAEVLVPGCGYGRNLLQLASFYPSYIIAFDLYEYPEEWDFVKKKAFEVFGVPIKFVKGDYDVIGTGFSFDHIISDAVLEHVKDMPKFMAASARLLKPGGVFYASFGPLWYGPGGDHADWGIGREYDHLLLSEAEYKRQVQDAGPEAIQGDSCGTGFLLQEDLFSKLKADQYLKEADKCGLEVLDVWSKFSPGILKLLERNRGLNRDLSAKGVPLFDRFCGGMYIWARKKDNYLTTMCRSHYYGDLKGKGPCERCGWEEVTKNT